MDLVIFDNFEISYNIVKNRRKLIGAHIHKWHELYYLIDGETKYFIEDKIYSVKPGNFVFVPSGALHKTDSEECMHNERLLFNLDNNFFDEEIKYTLELLSRENVIYIPSNIRHKVIDELIFKIMEESENITESSKPLLRSYIKELLIQVCRLKQEYKPKQTENEKIVYKITEFIRQNYSDNLSLETLCETFYLDKFHLSRMFKKVSGIGLNEFITYVRITNAESMLVNTNMSVSEIASKCGFNDSSYFASVFKKLKGVTPYKYSKRI